MSTIEHDRQSEGVGRILGLVMGATLRAAAFYVDHGASPELPEPNQRRAILTQLQVVAGVLRVVDAHRGLLDPLTDALDPAPTIAVLRAVQDSLILALSDDSGLRAQRIGERELRERLRAAPVRLFLDPREP